MTGETVTIYMPTRNRRDLAQRAIRSVLAQTYEDIELVVVDDGSDDGTQDLLAAEAARDKRVRPILGAQPQGACAARNRAIAAASGRWITGCDDDDLFLPDRVRQLVQAWREVEAARRPCSALYTPYAIRDRRGRETPAPVPDAVDAATIKCRNAVGPQVFAPAETFRRSGGFDPELPAWQDYDLWFRMILEQGPMLLAGASTYVMDQSHAMPRISDGRASHIRSAYERFVAKHGATLDRRQRALLHLNYLQYDQVVFPPTALLAGWRAGELHAYAGGLLAKTLRRFAS